MNAHQELPSTVARRPGTTDCFSQHQPKRRRPEACRVPLGGEGYRIIRILGEGKFANVYLAINSAGELVALKITHDTLDCTLAQLELEGVELVSGLSHPNLMRIFGIWRDSRDRLVVEMELADGRLSFPAGTTLAEALDRGYELASALDFLGQAGIVHRDVKPENVLVLNGRPLLCDFSLARRIGDTDEVATICGTPPYMPAEIWMSRVALACDQYSLCCTLVKLITGSAPFPGPNFCEQHRGSIPNLSRFSPSMAAVLFFALSPDPAARYPSCSAFIVALREAAEADGLLHRRIGELASPTRCV